MINKQSKGIFGFTFVEYMTTYLTVVYVLVSGSYLGILATVLIFGGK